MARSIRLWSVLVAFFGIVAIVQVDNLVIRAVIVIAVLGLIPANYMVSETLRRQSSRS
jgi:hypothetical protein